MLWKDAFIYTLREDPAEAELISHKLMIRAGMIQKLASGIYNYLPCGLRVIKKIETIIREEMERCGASELLMPGVIPAQLWQESGRWNYYGPELLRFKDRKSNDFLLGPTHEEVVVDIARRAVRSYRDLPMCLYQIQSKFRDELRPRYGLMRGREFIMKDAYSFHADEQSLDQMYWRMHEAYTTIFKRCGLNFRSVEADSGTIGGDVTHEFHVLAASGEDTIAHCSACDYAANIEKATSVFARLPVDVADDAPAVEEVETPGRKTIEDVSAFLGVKPSDTIKMVVYEVDNGERLVAVCIRGDREVNEAKLRGLVGANAVSIPDDQQLAARTGLAIGYVGAYRFEKDAVDEVIADYSVAQMADAVCGANRPGYHVRHVYPARDFEVSRYADVGFVSPKDRCPRCKDGTLAMSKGIEVG
ncbi:MAG: proline--tRNA ligase, partial [Chitinivibrionales bacterium]